MCLEDLEDSTFGFDAQPVNTDMIIEIITTVEMSNLGFFTVFFIRNLFSLSIVLILS